MSKGRGYVLELVKYSHYGNADDVIYIDFDCIEAICFRFDVVNDVDEYEYVEYKLLAFDTFTEEFVDKDGKKVEDIDNIYAVITVNGVNYSGNNLKIIEKVSDTMYMAGSKVYARMKNVPKVVRISVKELAKMWIFGEDLV